MLHRAALAGVAIPDGIVVPESSFEAWCAAGYPLPAGLQGVLVAIRSAFSAEDAPHESHAGQFASVLRVPSDDRVALAAAVSRVRSSGERAAGHRDLIVMRFVDARHAGVAFTEREHEDDLVIHKLRMNEPLTAKDLQELERMLTESGLATSEHLQKAKTESNGLGLFVRCLV